MKPYDFVHGLDEMPLAGERMQSLDVQQHVGVVNIQPGAGRHLRLFPRQVKDSLTGG